MCPIPGGGNYYFAKPPSKSTLEMICKYSGYWNGYYQSGEHLIVNKKTKKWRIASAKDFKIISQGYCLEVGKDGKIVKSPQFSTTNPLRDGFVGLSNQRRLTIQSNLSSLGYYKSTIDGIYGSNTKTGLLSYNKNKLGNLDINKKDNVNTLLASILAVKTSNQPVPSSNSSSCSKNPKACTVAQLCDQATVYKNSKKVWAGSSKKKFINEAKRNGLSCNVEIANEKPSSDIEIFNVASGTGFYVSQSGHIITNNHVIDGCMVVRANAKGKEVDADILATDIKNDLAILKVKHKPEYVFPIAKSNPYELQEIIVAGYPFGNLVSSTIKFTKGIVSSISGLGNDYSQIQIDAALQPGNSGGPIVDNKGNAVAVAVAKLDLKEIIKNYGVVPEDTNFGIKASAVRNLLRGNSISVREESDEEISISELSKNIKSGTVFLSCWMTMAQIKEVKSKKVLFKDFE